MRSLSILMDVEAGVIDALKNVSRRPIQPVSAHDLIADLGFDSLQVLELVADLEDRFDITIPVSAVAGGSHRRGRGRAGRRLSSRRGQAPDV